MNQIDFKTLTKEELLDVYKLLDNFKKYLEKALKDAEKLEN